MPEIHPEGAAKGMPDRYLARPKSVGWRRRVEVGELADDSARKGMCVHLGPRPAVVAGRFGLFRVRVLSGIRRPCLRFWVHGAPHNRGSACMFSQVAMV